MYNPNAMSSTLSSSSGLPDAAALRRAVAIYASLAFPSDQPPSLQRFELPDGADVGAWLMTDVAERSPDEDTPLEAVRSFALRLGNCLYPNMKLRISRPPSACCAVFHVDAHDAMLKAPEGSPDQQCLEEVKAHNAELASRITDAWEREGLVTERTYLRRAIDACRQREGD